MSPAQRKILYRDLSNVDLRSAVSVADQVNGLKFPTDLKIPQSHLYEASNVFGFSLVAAPASAPALAPAAFTPGSILGVPLVVKPPAVTKLSFVINRLKCVDETNGAFGLEWGSDEMYLSGTTLAVLGFSGCLSQRPLRRPLSYVETRRLAITPSSPCCFTAATIWVQAASPEAMRRDSEAFGMMACLSHPQLRPRRPKQRIAFDL